MGIRKSNIELLTKIYVFIMLAIFPLATSDNYFDILDIKWLFTVIPTCLFILTAIVLKIVKKERLELYSPNNKILFVFAMLLVTSVVVGIFFCTEPLISFWGITGRYLGLMVIVPLVLSTLIVSNHFEYSRIIYFGTIISSLIVFIFQILHEFKIDIFGMWDGMMKEEIPLFTSTIGNINFNATYNCMIISIAIAIFVSRSDENSQTENVLSIAYIALAFAASICLRSNGFFLGIAASLIALYIYSIKNIEKLKGIAYTLLSFAIGSALVFVLTNLAKKSFKLKSLSSYAIDIKIIGLEILVAVIIYLLSERLNRTILIGIGIVALAIVIFTVFFGENPVLDYSKINDHSMHNRIYVWRKTLEYIKTFTPLQLLFGCGINDFQFGFVDFCGQEMQQLGYNTFIDAHSEYLQAFASTGLIGFVGYFGMIITTLNHSIRNKSNGIIATSFIIAFMAQGLVYGPQITTTPILFIMLGIFWSRSFDVNEL